MEEINRFVFIILGIAGAAFVSGGRRCCGGAAALIGTSNRRHALPAGSLPFRPTVLCPSSRLPAGTLQFACLIWAGAAQANRVRRLYLASLLSQVS